MKYVSSVYLFALILLAMVPFVGCKKNTDTLPENQLFDTTTTSGIDDNQSDTIVSLRNGLITLIIPAGSMKEGTKINIKDSNVKFVDTAHLLHQFQLNPVGLKFNKPVTMIFHYDSTWLKGNSPWNIGIAYRNEAGDQWYPAVNGEVDPVNHTISIKTTHFSLWSIYTCFHLYMKADGQLSEDYSQIIRMQPGDIGLLLLAMDEPPAWKADPDKSKEFGNPLVAPLTRPPIEPKESYSKSLTPDEWDVNAIIGGDEYVGKILPVSGAQEKLYQYIAPQIPPESNPVAISATIHTLNHGDIILIQGVEIRGKWKLNVVDSTFIVTADGESDFAYQYSTVFHINNQSQIIYDGETHSTIKFFKLIAPGIVSWNISSVNYLKISNITGTYDAKINKLNCKVTIGFFHGTTTETLCNSDGCITYTNDGAEYNPGIGNVSIGLEAESGIKFLRDTTFAMEGGKVHIYETYALSSDK